MQWCLRKCYLQDSDMDVSSPLMYVDSFHRRPPWSRWTKERDLQAFFIGSPCHLMTSVKGGKTQNIDKFTQRYSGWPPPASYYPSGLMAAHYFSDFGRQPCRVWPMVDRPQAKDGIAFTVGGKNIFESGKWSWYLLPWIPGLAFTFQVILWFFPNSFNICSSGPGSGTLKVNS